MSETKLLPCPFCGGEATLRKSEVTQLYHVACFECGCRQDSSYKSESAINAWNTRKPMDDIVERLEEFCFEESKNSVKDLAEEHNNGWIPCERELPELEADVLLSLRSLDIYTGFRANTEGCFYVEGEGYVEFENVLAWQPLPAPYKKGE